MLLFIKQKVPEVYFITAKHRASKGNGSWKNYSKEKTAITFGEECIWLEYLFGKMLLMLMHDKYILSL